MSGNDHRELPFDAAESKTLCMRGNSLRENRETPRTSLTPAGEERSEKAFGRTADMHVLGESDGFIVPAKRANKAGLKAAAESVEGREPAKRNAERTLHVPDSVPGKHGIGLEGIRQASRHLLKVRAV